MWKGRTRTQSHRRNMQRFGSRLSGDGLASATENSSSPRRRLDMAVITLSPAPSPKRSFPAITESRNKVRNSRGGVGYHYI